MDILLWIAQILLALGFIFVGFNHATRAQQMQSAPNMEWIGAVPGSLMSLIGVFEIAGGIGVVMPAITGIFPWLTAWAAIGLALIMLFAFLFHIVRREYPNLTINAALFLLAVFVAFGRLVLLPI